MFHSQSKFLFYSVESPIGDATGKFSHVFYADDGGLFGDPLMNSQVVQEVLQWT